MELDIRFDCNGVDWQIVAQTLKKVGMALVRLGDVVEFVELQKK
jgi:hypothetical protein